MEWTVELTKKATKGFKQLKQLGKEKELILLTTLISTMRTNGPVRGEFPNYSKLSKTKHHCHLSRDYVCCWEVKEKKVKILEVYYVGSREKAPY